MAAPFQAQNRQEIRHAIGRHLGDVIIGVATSTGDTSSLIDAIRLAKFGDDEINGRQVIIYDATGSIVDGEQSWVSDFGTNDATCAPVFTANITAGDKYEIWNAFTVEEINAEINNAIIRVTRGCLQPKVIATAFTSAEEYEYNCLSGFVGVYLVEYVNLTGIGYTLETCDIAWSGTTSGYVTVTADTIIKKVGNASVKMVATADLAANTVMTGQSITDKDISQCDTLEIWVYSTVALSAGDLQVILYDTSVAKETLNIPATTANTWTRHLISLANPASDTAIDAVYIKQVTDKGAFTLYVDDIKAVKSTSRKYIPLAPDEWSIVKGSTPYLQLTPFGLGSTGYPTQLRLSGYQIPALLSDDTTDCEIDPDYIIAYVTGNLFINHIKSSRLEINDRQSQSKYWLSIAESLKTQVSSNYKGNTKWVN